MRRIGQESARMRGLVEDLLLLARLGPGRAAGPRTRRPRRPAADAVLDASATHPSGRSRWTRPSRWSCRATRRRLRQVLANLLSNALVHTDRHTTVEVRAERRGDAALLAVSDDGPGMTPHGRRPAFDRFWPRRPGPARAVRGRARPGHRAGLVAAHHG
jgi:two-component system OmpR family sensor kinase